MSSSSSEIASGKLVLDEPAEHVLRIRISNPDKRGALDHEILDNLAQTLRTREDRCVVITGDGPVFSAGYDIGGFDDPEQLSDAAEKLVAHPFTNAIEAIEEYRFPVIAALNGHAIGGGLELAISCDIRIAASQVKVGMPPAKIGLIYSHTGLKKFMELNGQLIALSRKNTNVHSLMLSLDEKRKVTLACQDKLRELQAALAKRGYTGIRDR